MFIVDCAWNDWSEWGSCDATCGGGTQVRRRTVDSLAANGGTDCTGYEEDIRACNTQCCPGKLINYCCLNLNSAQVQSWSLFIVDCSWGEWTEYGACSEDCDGGNQTRVRVKTLESCGGNECGGDDIEIQSCNNDPCPGNKINMLIDISVGTILFHLHSWLFLEWMDCMGILLSFLQWRQ